MTRGYFVEEQNNKITRAAELTSSAYLAEGYGIEIMTAYKNGVAGQYLDDLLAEMTPEQGEELEEIVPEWYRITIHSRPGEYHTDYAYVLKNNQLFVYHQGARLFVANQNTIDVWIFVVENLCRFENTYLYNAVTLNMEYKKYRQMFLKLEARIQSGCTAEELEAELLPADFIPAILSDDHCTDIWNKKLKPAYIKKLSIDQKTIKFIVSKVGKWYIHLQLPYCRVPILTESGTERGAVDKIRNLVKTTRCEELIQFADVSSYVSSLLKSIHGKVASFDLEPCRQELQDRYDKQAWLCSDNLFSVDIIMRELGLRMNRGSFAA